MAEPKDDHCWHVEEAALVKPVKPPIYQVRCCNCGASGTASMKSAPLPGHGPFVVMQQLSYPKRQPCFPKF